MARLTSWLLLSTAAVLATLLPNGVVAAPQGREPRCVTPGSPIGPFPAKLHHAGSYWYGHDTPVSVEVFNNINPAPGTSTQSFRVKGPPGKPLTNTYVVGITFSNDLEQKTYIFAPNFFYTEGGWTSCRNNIPPGAYIQNVVVKK